MMATGWLGWSPRMALDTPIGQIDLALAGKIDFLKKTNPFGSKEETDEEKRDREFAENAPGAGHAAERMLAFFQSRQAHSARHAKKK